MTYKKQLGILLMVVFLLLSACSSNSSDLTDNGLSPDTGQSEDGLNADRVELTDDYAEDALSIAQQLTLGSLLLEETDLAVDPELASDLIPYWKLYRSLLGSDTTAPEELDSLLKEIQEIMTAEQVSFIANLQLNQETMMTLVNEMGIFDLKQDGTGEGGIGFIPPEGLPDGVRPGGGQGGGQGGGDGSIDPELMATKQAERAAAGGGRQSNRLTIPLVEALISLLEGKISG
ncbi:MAG: hypothetical protein GQ562_08045 [Anaerolineales bacterium]|nr:hypothetical protein [Anaerolineales bacterium]